MKGLKMKVEKIELTKMVPVTTGYKMNVVNDCNTTYSENELNVYNEWIQDLYTSNFLGDRSNISELVLNRILSETLKKYNITRKF